jgi:hypothetical protein
LSLQIPIRYINQHTIPLVTNLDVSKLTEFEKSNNPEEWYYVERCLPLKVVPAPKQFDGTAPSGWIPPRGKFYLQFNIRISKIIQLKHYLASCKNKKTI